MLKNQELASVVAGGKTGRLQLEQRWDQANLRHRSLLERVEIELGGTARTKKKIIPSLTLTLTNEEFLRRFLQHVLSKGFPRIRYFGWLANRKRATLLPVCRDRLACQPPAPPMIDDGEATVWQCPRCHGPMQIIERLTASHIPRKEIGYTCALDSS